MSDERLSEREYELWHAAKKLSETLSAKVMADVNAASGVSLPELQILNRLDTLGNGRLVQQELMKSLGWDKSRLSHLLTRMQKRLLIERHPAGRSVEVVISGTGTQILSAALPAYTKAIRRHLLDRITDRESETLLALCAKISH